MGSPLRIPFQAARIIAEISLAVFSAAPRVAAVDWRALVHFEANFRPECASTITLPASSPRG